MPCYATGTALNNVTPAHAGTLVAALMFVAIIPSATFAGVIAAATVEALLRGRGLVVIYLFLRVSGSFEQKFGFVSHHPWAVVLAVVGGAAIAAVGVGVARGGG